MIRSSKVKLIYSNKEKVNNLFHLFEDSVKDVVNDLINTFIYSGKKIPALPPKEITSLLPFSARVNQLISKEASSVARSIVEKINKASGKHNLEKYQQEIITKFNDGSLKVNWNGNLNLDSRFVTIEENNDSVEFDYWIQVKFPFRPRVFIPFKSTRHIKNLLDRGYTMKTAQLKICRNNSVILFFEKTPSKNENTETVGIDVGRNKSFVTSRGETENVTKDILNSLKRKKHGSKNKARAVRRLYQTIDREIKTKIDFTNVKEVILENLTEMKIGNRWGNINHHWSYRYIQNRIRLTCEELDVLVREILPAYTSQTCSGCGFKHKNNRYGEQFLCLSCGQELDADLNAARNIRNRGINSTHDPRN